MVGYRSQRCLAAVFIAAALLLVMAFPTTGTGAWSHPLCDLNLSGEFSETMWNEAIDEATQESRARQTIICLTPGTTIQVDTYLEIPSDTALVGISGKRPVRIEQNTPGAPWVVAVLGKKNVKLSGILIITAHSDVKGLYVSESQAVSVEDVSVITPSGDIVRL